MPIIYDGARPEDLLDDEDSGPFCMHWASIDSCPVICTREGCGHRCHAGPCLMIGCTCEEMLNEPMVAVGLAAASINKLEAHESNCTTCQGIHKYRCDEGKDLLDRRNKAVRMLDPEKS